ncbi:hypothetical protein GCM10011338_39610 [Alteromonas lipolytica]|uniref:STAS domain-containing protein n=1 Tax=Alteromonas lipolytica TaxID=1856405 RepID=A0A1E8F8R5_9ALTE|nr:hypothetical protein BFC17_08030 [Alteromonas lipolytica]GGF83371.1 hypothetical protein GCM10011338_39610 [Alteromonas lipolytica]
MLPPVWTGLNALSVFSAIKQLPLELLEDSVLKIDFSEVQHLDSSGMGALVGLQKQLRSSQHTAIKITGASDCVKRLMYTANLHRLFLIENS